MSAYKHSPFRLSPALTVSRCIGTCLRTYPPVGDCPLQGRNTQSINEVCAMGVFRSQTPRACFCLTKSDYFSDSCLDLWAYPPFFSARIRAAFSMTDSRLSTVLSSHPASQIRVFSSAFVSSTSVQIFFSCPFPFFLCRCSF